MTDKTVAGIFSSKTQKDIIFPGRGVKRRQRRFLSDHGTQYSKLESFQYLMILLTFPCRSKVLIELIQGASKLTIVIFEIDFINIFGVTQYTLSDVMVKPKVKTSEINFGTEARTISLLL